MNKGHSSVMYSFVDMWVVYLKSFTWILSSCWECVIMQFYIAIIKVQLNEGNYDFASVISKQNSCKISIISMSSYCD